MSPFSACASFSIFLDVLNLEQQFSLDGNGLDSNKDWYLYEENYI